MLESNGSPWWVKVLLPLGITAAASAGAASWRQSMSNEGRITALESRQAMVAETLHDITNQLSRIEGALGRVEGRVEERAAIQREKVR